jgi:hypothetical protein
VASKGLQADEAEHGHEREIAVVAGFVDGGRQGLELQMREPERR